MHCVVEVNAGENREHERLQRRDEEFETGERHRHAERQDRGNAPGAGTEQRHDHAAEHLEHDVARKDVAEQSERVADRAGEMNMNREKTSGKNFIPSWPAVLRTMLAMNS